MGTGAGAQAASLDEAIQRFLRSTDVGGRALIAELDEEAAKLRDAEYRRTSPEVVPWPAISYLWRSLVRTIQDCSTAEEAEAKPPQDPKPAADVNVKQVAILVAISLARMLRNAAAGGKEAQERVFEEERSIRMLLFYATSFARLSDTECLPLNRALVQLLSNAITSNDDLQARLWETFVGVGAHDNLLIRVLTSPEPATVSATQVLILNCLRYNRERRRSFVTSPAGLSVVQSLLFHVDGILENENELEDGKTTTDNGDENPEDSIGLAYTIFALLFQDALADTLYRNLAPPSDTTLVTSSQVTLLKLLDSWLHFRGSQEEETGPDADGLTFLVDAFMSLGAFAEEAMRVSTPPSAPSAVGVGVSSQAVSTASDDSPASEVPEPDRRLPVVLKTLILFLHCFLTIALTAGDRRGQRERWNAANGKVLERMTSGDTRFVERLVSLLRQSVAFAPTLPAPGTRARHSNTSLAAAGPAAGHKDARMLMFLKRDLVRLIGALCVDDRATQDRVRECDGLAVLLGLTPLDDANPYIREHALFALRNLLIANEANQAYVKAMQPLALVGLDGELKDLPAGRG